MAIRKLLAIALLLWGALSLLPLEVTLPGVGDDVRIAYPQADPADLLLLQVRLHDPAPQWRRAELASVKAGVKFWILSDARPHWLLLPVGTLAFEDSDDTLTSAPDTKGEGLGVRGSAPPEVLRAIHLSRLPYAFDWVWLQCLMRLGVQVTRWDAFWLSALLLWSGLVFAAWGALRLWLRGVWLLHLLWSAAAVWAGASALLTGYLPLPERVAVQSVPAYNHPQDWQRAITPLLVGEGLGVRAILIYSPDPEGYLVFRARYLLYPHRVDALTFLPNPAELAQRLQSGGYSAWIVPGKGSLPPLAGWRDVSAPESALRVWVNSADGLPPNALPRAEGWQAWLRAGLFVGAVAVFGALLAGALGWQGEFAWGGGWLLGWLAVALWLFALHLAQIHWSLWTLILPLLWGIAVLWRRFGVPRVSRALLGLWLVGLLLLVPLAVAMPFGDQDTWTMWGFKGMAFFADGSLLPMLRLYARADLHHAGYPPLVPLSQVGVYLTAGGFSERLAKLLPAVTFVLLLGLLYAGLARVAGARRALWWTCTLLVTPLLLDHATLPHADLALALALLTQAIALQRFVMGETERNLWLAAGSACAAAWLRPDGAFLAVGLFAAALWVCRGRGGWRLWGVPLLLLGLIFALWRVYALANGLLLAGSGTFSLTNIPVNLGAGLRELMVTLLLNQRNSAWGLMGGGYGALWILTGGALLLGWRGIPKNPGVQFLGLSLLLGMGMYLGVYALREFYSMERYLLHLAPLAVLLAGGLRIKKAPLRPGVGRGAGFMRYSMKISTCSPSSSSMTSMNLPSKPSSSM